MEQQGLSGREKQHIELTERYRFEVKSKLEEASEAKPKMMEKLLFPALIVVLTAVISGGLLPWVFQQQSARTHQYEAQRFLLDELFEETTTIEVAMRSYYLAVKDYWLDQIDLMLRWGKAFARKSSDVMDESDFQELAQSLEADRLRLEEVYQREYDEYINLYDSFQIWQRGFSQKLVASYPDQETRIEDAFASLAEHVKSIDKLIDQRSDELHELHLGTGERARESLSEVQREYMNRRIQRGAFVDGVRKIEGPSRATEDEIRQHELEFMPIHDETDWLQGLILADLPKVVK